MSCSTTSVTAAPPAAPPTPASTQKPASSQPEPAPASSTQDTVHISSAARAAMAAQEKSATQK
jgi:hypothetical protein